VTSHVLSVLCALPLSAAGVVLFSPRQMTRWIRGFTLAAMLITFAWSLLLLRGNYATASMQFGERYALVASHGITFSVGVDGMSLWLVLLTTLMTPLAAFGSWSQIETKFKEYAIALLVLESALLCGFVALDLFLFYVTWELTLVPMFMLIGVWGRSRGAYAAQKFLLYAVAGGSLMLFAIVYLVAQYKAQTGYYSFELRHLKLLLLPTNTQLWIFVAFALAFAIKVPMFPLHSWQPDAYSQAPTGGTVMLSAVMAKLAAYGFLRFAMPLVPWGSHRASTTLLLLAVIGIVYGAYCAWTQSDVKKLVAYSSVSHLGFVMLGIYSVSTDGLRGSILQMVNHGISTGALFLLVGIIYARRRTYALAEFGGVAKVMPVYATMFILVSMSAIGLPATNGFIGEFMILAGAFASEMLGKHGPVAAVLAATALILAPMYMLHAVYKIFWGPLDNPVNRALTDLTGRERLLFAPLLALIFFIGLFPKHMLEPMTASVDNFAIEYVAKLRTSDRNPNTRGLLEDNYQLQPAPDAPRRDRRPLVNTIPRGN
jgi:NADH-quinone oxidoreductase subunit M